VLAFNSLRNTHRPRYIDAKNHRYVLIASHFLILNLGCSLHQVVNLVDFGDFLLIDENLVFVVAKFTCPQLAVLTHHGLKHALAIEHSMALLAKYRVTSSHSTCVF
jgi:hypothetical protein